MWGAAEEADPIILCTSLTVALLGRVTCHYVSFVIASNQSRQRMKNGACDRGDEQTRGPSVFYHPGPVQNDWMDRPAKKRKGHLHFDPHQLLNQICGHVTEK